MSFFFVLFYFELSTTATVTTASSSLQYILLQKFALEMPFNNHSSHQRRAVSLFGLPSSVPNSMDYRRNTRGSVRMSLFCLTLLNGFFTVVSLVCAIILILYYKNAPVISESQWRPFDGDVSSNHDYGEDHSFHSMVVKQIRSAGKKRGRRNPLLVATGLFIVAGIFCFSLLWMLIDRKLKISERLHKQKAIAMRRFGWHQGGNQEAENQGEGAQGAQNEADANGQVQTQGIVHPRSQTPRPQSQTAPSTGELTLNEPVAERDLEAQYDVEHAHACDNDGRTKTPEGQQQEGEQEGKQEGQQNPSESTVTMQNRDDMV
jgi:hypothetical protein